MASSRLLTPIFLPSMGAKIHQGKPSLVTSGSKRATLTLAKRQLQRH